MAEIDCKSYAAESARAKLAPWSFKRRALKANDVLVEILFSGICHSDIHQAREEWGAANFPMVPGHEIVGKVKAIGSAVSKFSIGETAGVGVYVDSCRTCANCLIKESNYCLEGMTGTYNAKERDGSGFTQGGYSNCIVVNEDYVLHVPDNLDLAGTAPLLCAGITLYSPLKHWNAGPGKKIAIVGLGGLGHCGVKFGKAFGAEITVLSHSPSKEADALKMGADKFFSTKDESVFKSHTNYFDLIINTVSADIDLNPYLGMLKLDGTLTIVGLPGKPAAIHAFSLLGQRRSLAGSMIGNIEETQEMLNFAGKHNIVCDVEVIKGDYINDAYERVISSDVKYRFVIDCASSF